MSLADYDFELPGESIAQRPAPNRDQSRLMLMTRQGDLPRHHRFPEILELLPAGSVLVLNDTRVIPARLRGRKPTGGAVELLLVEPLGDGEWLCMGRASKAFRPGLQLQFPGDGRAVVVATRAAGYLTVRFENGAGFSGYLEQHGEMPLPPYIGRASDEADRLTYQTVYARNPGAVAAPTAGLHFTPEILQALEERGVELLRVTLHVGPGTFMPIRSTIEEHRMHEERYEIPQRTAERIALASSNKQPIVAVGTTVVRTLEAAAIEAGVVKAGAGRTDLFIQPGFRFKVVDHLLTNFHLPRSTLLLLVAALVGRDRLLTAYREAIASGYRFYSYGDAMLIL